jgi:outer membrane receptor protein involved in Fe transport
VILAAITTLAAIASGPVRSQSTSAKENTAEGLEEIIVTARKREESVMKTPVVMQVFTQEQINDLKIQNFEDLALVTPGLLVNRTDTSSTVYFRGIGNGEGAFFADMAVLLNVDGLSLTNAGFYRSAMFDTAQIEVLKGPQALFYGRSASAGIIAVHSADPTSTWETQGRVGYEFYADERDLDGFISGPITDKLGIRIAAYNNIMQGYFTDPKPDADSPRVPNEEDNGERITLKYDDPGLGFRAKLKVADDNTFSNSWNGDISQLTCANPPTPRNPARAGQACAPGDTVDTSGRGLPYNPNVDWPNSFGNAAAFETGSPDPLFRNGVGYQFTRTFMVALNIDYDIIPGLTVTSVTGHLSLRARDVGLYDQPPPLGVAAEFDQYADSEELRLTSNWKDSWINFIAGGLYNPDHGQDYTVINVPIATYYTTNSVRLDSKIWSGFGQVLLTPIPKWELALGARFTSVTKDLGYLTYGGNTAGFYPPNSGIVGDITPHLPRSVTHYDETNTSPEATLTYRPTDDWTAFVAFKEGYRGPGMNVNESAAIYKPGSLNFYHGETAKGGEGGVKALLLDHRLSLTADIYRYDYSNLQVAYVSATNFTVMTANGADARTQGIEFAAAYSPAAVEGLTLNGAINYNHSYYTSFPFAPCYAGQATSECNYPPGQITGGYQNNAGKTLAHAPRTTGQVSGNYKFNVTADYSMEFSTNVNFSSYYQADPYLNPYGIQAGYATIDAALRFGKINGPWEFAVIGRDLNNRYIVSSGLEEGTTTGPGQIGDVIDYVNRPRQILLQFTVRPKLL